MTEPPARSDRAKIDGNDNQKGISSSGDTDSDSDSKTIAINDIPPNPTESKTDSMDNRPPGESGHPAEVKVADVWRNYWTIDRWRHRLSLWEEYMKIRCPKELPDPTEFLFSIPPDNDIAHRIWGDGEDSLKSRFMKAKIKQAKLEKELPQMQSELEELKNELCQLESEAKELKDTSKNVEPDGNLTQADSTMSSEQLEIRRLKKELLALKEDRIKSVQIRIKWREGDMNMNDREHIAKDMQHTIKCRLQIAIAKHERARSTLSSLDACRDDESTDDDDDDCTLDENRFNISYEPELADFQKIFRATADRNFLTEVLKKKDIVRNRELLFQLQTFVADLLGNANVASNPEKRKDFFDEQIKATVDAILNWKPGTTVESLGQLNGRFACPPFNACEALADQPILCALIIRIMAILGPSCLPVSREHIVTSAGAAAVAAQDTEECCWFDCVVDDYKNCFHVLFPGTLGRVFTVKPMASQNNPTAFRKDQRRTRAQVIEQMAQRLHFPFDFGGIGHDDVVRGVVLSMFSVQVLEMKLLGVGTEDVDIGFRQTAHVPLLGKRLVPENIHNAVAWDMGCDGVLLLASAILGLQRKSLFGTGSVQTTFIDDVTAADYYSQHGQEHEHEHLIRWELLSQLGSGSFHHVVNHGERMFMKIPRSLSEVQFLTHEFEILKKLNEDRHACIPMTMSWGVSVVNLSIRNEISQIKVLRMTGTVGHSLGSCCENKYLMKKKDIHCVIQKVYDALEYAHSKDIVHMAVAPCNIIVKQNGEGFNVLLTGWSCSMLLEERIGGFVGCRPYAHDEMLRMTKDQVLKAMPDFDFASLGYTWYHVIEGAIDWKFNLDSDRRLQRRRTKMESFLKKIGKATIDLVPKVRDIFDRPRVKERRLSSLP